MSSKSETDGYSGIWRNLPKLTAAARDEQRMWGDTS